jgi:predicted nucleic acid-binding protein
MTVLDASSLLELLLHTAAGSVVAERIADPSLRIDTPHLADVEVLQVLRRYVRDGELAAAAARTALEDLRSLDLVRHAHEPLLERVWELRQNLSAYDATYVALAEALETTLITCDARLARAPGVSDVIELVSAPA